MEALFIFIAKSGGLLVLFYFAYFLLLRKETFFSSNRWFLLAGLITSVVLPFVVYTKIVWVDPVPIQNMGTYSAMYIPHTIMPEETFEINWNYVTIAIYSIGFCAFLLKFAIDFYSLNTVLKGKNVQQQADFKFIDINENIAPFSYFDYIVYNSSMFSAAELENIIEHEKVHSDQNHTVDVLISRIFCILFWFNPIMWFYKKAIIQNLEFIADYEAAKRISDKKAYQYTLLKITTHESCVTITNHFYQSLIKKRIVMLNKNQSKKWNYWKYYAIIPALVGFVLLFQIKTIAQERKQTEKEVVAAKPNDVDVYKIRKNTTDQELKEMAEKLKSIHNVDMTVSNVKRNTVKELTSIKIDIKKGNEEFKTINIEGDNPIKDCGIVIETDNDGSKKINLITNGDAQVSMMDVKQPQTITTDVAPVEPVEPVEPVAPVLPAGSAAPPAPPVPPAFPAGPLPAKPAIDMSKMPKPPTPPRNKKDKVAMANFDKQMDEFDKKMEAFEPQLAPMETYGSQVEEIMSKREAIFDKEMAKYEVAMEKYNADMEKSGNYNYQILSSDKDYKKSMEQFEIDMKQHAKDMKQFEKDRRQQQRDLNQQQKDMQKS